MSKKRNKNLRNQLSDNRKTSPVDTIQPNIQTTKGSSIIQESIQHWIGPLPPPEILKKYDEIYPGMVKLICDKYDEQSKHRISLENKVVDSNIRNESRGQWMSFFIFLTAMLGSLILLCQRNTAGFTTFFSSFGGLIIQYILHKSQSKRELEQKREPKLQQEK